MERRERVGRYRDELKGLAILWILFFHAQFSLPAPWNLLHDFGYGGVDIFLFLLGYGLCRSRRNSADLGGFYARRLWRTLPAYLPLLIAWMAIMYPTYGLKTTEIIRGVAGNLTMTGYWLQTPKVYNWFANGQFFFFLIAPACYAALARTRKPALALLMLLALASLAGLACIAQKQLMGASRLPVFLLGMALGMDWRVSEKRNLARAAYALAFAVGLGTLIFCYERYPWSLSDYGTYWYPFALVTPPLCVFLAFLFQKVEKARKVFAPLRWLGRSSFELYLINIWMVELAKKAGLTGAWPWALLCAGNLLLGLGYHALVERGTAALRARVDKTARLQN
jgi:peptidoglycan/LPS O-acetylase OafA/YrhL